MFRVDFPEGLTKGDGFESYPCVPGLCRKRRECYKHMLVIMDSLQHNATYNVTRCRENSLSGGVSKRTRAPYYLRQKGPSK